jgi:GAF domain-containing protein
MKVLKKLHQQSERQSLVKELIALRPISPVVTRQTHPFQTLYADSNPPPVPIDQFAPYLSRKLTLARNTQIEKMKQRKTVADPTFVLTNSVDAQATAEKSQITEHDCNVKHDVGEAVQASPAHGLEAHLRMEQTFDKIAANSASTALHRLMESTLQVHFLAEKVLFYHDIASVKVLYCPSTTGYCDHGSGLVGYSHFSRRTISAPQAGGHVAYSASEEGTQCERESPVLVFPLFDASSHVRAVIEIIRAPGAPIFTEEDERFVEYFQTKCKMYARWLFQPVLDDAFASDLMQTCRLRQFIERIREKLTRLFSCRGAEIWNYNRSTEVIEQYTSTSDRPVVMPANETGIPGYALRQHVPVSTIRARVHSAYHPKTDGNGDFSCLTIPVRDPDSPLLYALVLRGKRIPQFFTDNDEKILARIAPYVIASLNSAEIIEKNHRALKESMHQQKQLRSLLDVAETLSGQLQMDILIPKIMQRACELVKADRCSLFMVNETGDKLVTSFQGGLANAIEIPLAAGVVGYTATTGLVLNVKDAYDHPKFNRNMDLATGYRTLTLLCVPIFDDKHEVRGVTEMINKLDGVFTEEDEKLIQIFNVFCGISIENARLYRASIDLSLQIRSFLEISSSLSQPQTLKKMMKEILANTRKVLGAVRSMLFMIEGSGIVFTPFVTDEDADAMFKKVQQKKAEEAEDSLGVKRAIIAKLMHGKKMDFDVDAQREEEARNRMLEHVITMKESILENYPESQDKSLIMVPILSSDRACLGAVMMQWKKTLQNFTLDDQRLLESYSVFLSVSFERSKLKNIAQLGTMEVEMQAWMTTDERSLSAVPEKLRMTEEDRGVVLTMAFDSYNFQGIALLKVIFNIFELFKLFDHFTLPAQTVFSFLYELRQTYNAVPYHNWNHAVDATQFLAYQLFYGNLQTQLTAKEILIMFVACLCHDANHDGFSTAYNAKAEIPLGILFNNQSVLETHHCTVAISVLTHENANIFQSFDDAAMAAMWPIFLHLILSTDMYRHFDIMDDFRAILESKRKWTENVNDRLTMMQVLIKTADLSTATRSFQNADKFSLNVCEEFFRQGQLDRITEAVYDDGIVDRDHLNKERSQLAFYKEACLPLFELLGRGVTMLGTLSQHLKLNISKWEEIEARRKEEEETQAAHLAQEEEEAKETEETQKVIDAIELDQAEDARAQAVLDRD